MPTQGKFVWHDLMTTDVETARRFYSQFLGWEYDEHDMGEMGKYIEIKTGGKGIGGIIHLEKNQNLPSHWVGYVSVDDVDKACERISSLNGQICVPPTDIPNVGRFAVANDPQGGTFQPFKDLHEMPESNEMPKPGEFCWDELWTTDPEAAVAFYQNLLGWTYDKMNMGEGIGEYWIVKCGESLIGGIMKLPYPLPRPCWIPYIAVENVDQKTEQARSLGAEIHAAPFDIPNFGRSSVLADPTGATLALFQGA